MIRRWIAGLAVAAAASLGAVEGASATATSCCIPWQEPGEIVVSPDGQNFYASDNNIAIAVAVDRQTGALTMLDTYDSGGEVAEITPDGRNVYFAARRTRRFSSFARDASGRLTKIPAPANVDTIVHDLASSRDGRQLYVADAVAGAIIILDRDPATGALTRRDSVHLPIDADPRWGHLKTIELSPDGKFLYAQVDGNPHGIVTLARADDGGLVLAGRLDCSFCRLDLAISPDGRYLFDESSPLTIDRDPATGTLSNPRDNESAPRTQSKPDPRDGRMSLSPDGKTLYMLDAYDGRLYAASVGDDGSIAHLATYREAVDGVEGLRDTQSVTVSAAGDFVFVASGVVDPSKLGRVAAFRRDPATGILSFADVMDGPDPRTGRGPGGGFTPSLTINNGAAYTNDPDVELTITGFDPRLTFGLLISNDGGFGRGAEQRAVTPGDVYEWTLASSGPERLPKTVYARTVGPFNGGPMSDDIILDERDPVVQYVEAPKAAARAARRITLKVRARDTLSGVAKIQVTTNKRKPGAWKKFTSRPVARATRKAMWVRVRDRAGNASRWRQAKVRRR